MFTKKKIGIIGMGTMGRSLALNFERNGYSVSIFNRSSDKMRCFIIEHPESKLEPYYSVKDFILSLERPRCVLIIIKSGSGVDQMITSLVPLLEKGDLIIDGGNSFYKDTIRRHSELSTLGIYFIGLGISGGELGALYGPAFMPSGPKDAYDNIFEPIFKGISAHFEDESCISYIGSDGSGHYVKMVHNGIEYADMQLISEAYALLKYAFSFNNEELSEIFDIWDRGELNSYLIYITKKILLVKNENGNYLLDDILDVAENNGTGQWLSQSALDFGEPLNIITESVFSRYMSTLKSQRLHAAKILSSPVVRKSIFVVDRDEFIEKIRKALYLCKIISYSQGFSQLRVASNQYCWNLNYSNIAKIFRAGCIIRAKLLEHIIDSYVDMPLLVNLLLAPYFKNIANSYHNALRDVVVYAVQNGVSMPSFMSAIGYYDSYRADVLPSSLIQAQRDCFGAHGYKRIDSEGTFYTNWLS